MQKLQLKSELISTKNDKEFLCIKSIWSLPIALYQYI